MGEGGEVPPSVPSAGGGGAPGSTDQLVMGRPSGGKGERTPAGLPRWSARRGGGRLDEPDAMATARGRGKGEGWEGGEQREGGEKTGERDERQPGWGDGLAPWRWVRDDAAGS